MRPLVLLTVLVLSACAQPTQGYDRSRDGGVGGWSSNADPAPGSGDAMIANGLAIMNYHRNTGSYATCNRTGDMVSCSSF